MVEYRSVIQGVTCISLLYRSNGTLYIRVC